MKRKQMEGFNLVTIHFSYLHYVIYQKQFSILCFPLKYQKAANLAYYINKSFNGGIWLKN